ncbi:fumarylacetoacetate hydrolase family protein [Nocardia sp. alder85J]|uniref:fumarylacetoacetate hydrolase family protein n=1 Tax=Nocardia sp. alder85J TaxID=2862949 RepID=UPI001CD40311|nr:fumarylacetoacetate hydrolase family protein [Nocardia sp. alder85J]MCX4091323.1 fumarylacetoacetate hydrolase family protein [Nocardia sp. alder85J]
MRIANLAGRGVFVLGGEDADLQAAEIAAVSGGRFGPDLGQIYQHWDRFRSWAATLTPDSMHTHAFPLNRALLGAPSPAPRQVFAVGLNYREHVAETGFAMPEQLPPVFTKYLSSFSGPDSTVVLPVGGHVDWEVELVVIIGRELHRADPEQIWPAVAGVTVGQDLSERLQQFRGPAAQFGLGKSFPGFAPQGPWLVTPDELADRDDLELGCAIDGQEVQKARTGDLIFPVPQLLSRLSHTVVLQPGDVIFTGTPAGVGMGRDPQRFLQPGETLDSWIEGIGTLRQTFVAGR